ncbi:MAG: Gfo/Idh/MocA family oxidoreductase [Thiolinea sp.]
MSIRVAIIGTGIMGTDHARIVAGDLPGATLQLVCDASEERARRVADEFGAATLRPMVMPRLHVNDVDAIMIASPDETHAGLCLAAMQAGKPVLCEKPLAPTPEECRS